MKYRVTFGILEPSHSWWEWEIDIDDAEFAFPADAWHEGYQDYDEMTFETAGLYRFEKQFPGIEISGIAVLFIEELDDEADSFKRGFKDALAGNIMPLEQMWKELEEDDGND